MNRRTYLAAVGTAGVAATAGCSADGAQTLSDPRVTVDAPGRKALIFESDGTEVGHLGVDGYVEDGRVDLSTEIWHMDGTDVVSVGLQLWMPETARESPARVAVVSPVEGDSSPPPAIALSTPERGLGTRIDITDLDDLADETISTLDLIVVPGTETATELTVQTTIELAETGVLGDSYTLEGRLQLSYPELAEQEEE